MGLNAGYRGTYVISWSQTELDGICAAPLATLAVGAQWRWWGEAARIDGPDEVLTLQGALGSAELHSRAARSVGRLLRMAGLKSAKTTCGSALHGKTETGDLPIQGFTVTDGAASYSIKVVTSGNGAILLLFDQRVPPRDIDLFVLDHATDGRVPTGNQDSNPSVICFTPGTNIETPEGPRLVEDIRPGDRISTKDDGAQAVLWTGRRRMTGARLHAMPHLRPVRIRAGAMGEDRPDRDLIVSPEHRLLVRAASSESLFNESEVLVAASDLIDGRMVLTETGLREVTYIHLMTERHQIVWANGMETESFHPANASLEMIDAAQRAALLDLMPEIGMDPYRYGNFARRNLTASEAAILRFEVA